MRLVDRVAASFSVVVLAAGLGLGALPAVASPASAPLATAVPAASVRAQSPSSSAVVSVAGKPAPSVPRNPGTADVLVNRNYPLVPARFAPKTVRVPGSSFRLQAPAASAYQRLVAAARRDGVTIRLTSAYRSYATQQSLMTQYMRAYGAAYARSIVAPAGASEHQTGWAVDVGAPGRACALRDCFASTTTGRWMTRNAAKFGFILRYPKGQEKVTGYRYEPWHFRYLGPAAAKRYTASPARTLEAYYRAPVKPAAKPATTKPAKQATRTTTANLNLRAGAGTGHRVLATVRRGTRVGLTGKHSGSWYQVTHGSRTGWMSGQYLR